MKLFFSASFFLNLLVILPNKSFLVIGKIIKKPTKSVAKPGTIKRSAPKAMAAPEIISYAGVSFLFSWGKSLNASI